MSLDSEQTAPGTENRAPDNAIAAPAKTGAISRSHYETLDGMRFLAAGFVVVAHTIGIGRTSISLVDQAIGFAGHFGLAAFFFLSGFLLFEPFVSWTIDDVSFPSYWWYFRRRILRIAPLYWVALTVYILYVPSVTISETTGGKVQTYLFGHIYSFGRVFDGIFSAWTLGIELGFYIALPVIAWAARFVAMRFGANRFSETARNLCRSCCGFCRINVLENLLPQSGHLFAASLVLAHCIL